MASELADNPNRAGTKLRTRELSKDAKRLLRGIPKRNLGEQNQEQGNALRKFDENNKNQKNTECSLRPKRNGLSEFQS